MWYVLAMAITMSVARFLRFFHGMPKTAAFEIHGLEFVSLLEAQAVVSFSGMLTTCYCYRYVTFIIKILEAQAVVSFSGSQRDTNTQAVLVFVGGVLFSVVRGKPPWTSKPFSLV